MTKNLNIATILLNLILVFTLFAINNDLFAASVNLISPIDFDRCIESGDIEFKGEYNNLAAGENITSAKIVIVNYTNKELQYEIPIDIPSSTSLIINSETLELESSVDHTGTIVAFLGEADSITAIPHYFFAIQATPLFGTNSIADNAVCVETSKPIVFDGSLEDNYYTDYVVQISENESFENYIIAETINNTSASATLATNTTYYGRLQDARCENNVSAARTFTTELATATNLLPKDFGTCEDLFLEIAPNQIKLQGEEPNTGSNYKYNIKLWNITDDTILITELVVLDANFILDLTNHYNQKLQGEVTTIDEENECQSPSTGKLTFFTPMATPIIRYPANDETCVLLKSIFKGTDEEAEKLDSLATNDIHYQFRISENGNFPEDSTTIIDVISDEDIDEPNKTGLVTFSKPNTTYYGSMRKMEVLYLEDADEETENDTVNNYSQGTSTFAVKTAIATTALVSPIDSLFGVDTELQFAGKNNVIASNYRLQIASDVEFDSIIIDTLITDTTYLFENITAEHQDYYGRVSCLNDNGNCESDFTEQRLFSLRLSAPTIVSPQKDETTVSNTVAFVWNKVLGANIYDIEYSTSKAAFETQPNLIKSQSNIVDTTCRIALDANTTYYGRVRAKRNQNIYSVGTDIYSFQSGNTTPLVPTLVSPLHNQERVSRLSTFFWNKTSNATSYELEIASSNDFATGNIVLNRTVPDTNYTIKDSISVTNDTIKVLLPNARYYGRVRAINGDLHSAGTVAGAFTTFLDRPTTAVNLTTPAHNDTNVYADDITFSWSYNPQAQGYKIKLMDTAKTVILDTNIHGLTTFRYTKLDTNKTYYWQVLPCNENGDGTTWSQEFMFKTQKVTDIFDNSIISSINVYPNPISSNSVLIANILQPTNLNIKIYDINGNEVRNIHTYAIEGTNMFEFNNNILPNTNILAKGTYTLFVFANGKLIGTTNFVLN